MDELKEKKKALQDEKEEMSLEHNMEIKKLERQVNLFKEQLDNAGLGAKVE